MEIINISPETEPLFYCCLEDWSDEMKEAGDHKQRWYERVKDKGLRVKFARDQNGVIGGMIQYLPIEISPFEGRDLYVVLCIWVHGYKQGRGNFRKRGMGKALLKAAEEDCREMGSHGLVTWGLILPVFMRASWFKRHGYRVVDKSGISRLLWKPFSENAEAPKFIKPRKTPEKGVGKVDISIFKTGWCPAMNIGYERTLKVSAEYEGKVGLRIFDTVDRQVFQEWGISDGIYIDGTEIRLGPPPSCQKIRKKIARRVARMK
jgi:GNAT superfamily N-acetyltransferase